MTQAMDSYQQKQPEPVEDRRWAAPRVDIYESDKEVLLLADLPGVSESRLNVALDKNQLTIEGRGSAPPQGALLSREIVGRDYRRVFVVPSGINAEKISASLTGGLLRLHLPKSERLQPRQIEVKAG